MKTFIFYCIFSLTALSLQAQQQKELIKGFWLNHQGTAVVEIFEEEHMLYGKIHEILKFPEEKSKIFRF